MSQLIELQILPESIAVLTFDRPGSKVNILSRALWEEFQHALMALIGNDGVKGLILTSAKPGVFIAGADLKELADAGPDGAASFIAAGNRVLRLLESVAFPTVAAIDGVALGGGLEVACACDYRICGTHPRLELGLPEINLGLIPGWGGTQLLPRLIDPPLALNRLLSGESFRVESIPEGSLVHRVADSGDLLPLAREWLLSKQDWSTVRKKKLEPLHYDWPALEAPSTDAGKALQAVVTEGCKLVLNEGIEMETEAFLRLAAGEEAKRKIAEFFASRKK